MRVINEVLDGKYDNHVMPFLWMHGQEIDKIPHYLDKIYESGIRAICIESRPHPNFLKEEWWQELDLIFKICQEKQMKVWILDDQHFPTGYAAGEIERHHSNLRKTYLDFKQFDFIGPQQNAGIILDWVFKSSRPNILSGEAINESSVEDLISESLVSIIAAKKVAYNKVDETTFIDLTDKVYKDTLFWDIPEGEWSIFIFYRTFEGKEQSTANYLNPINPEATDVLIRTVYQPHFERYAEYIGNVFLGFFSDEPRFGNVKGPDAIVGKEDMPLPWTEELLVKMSEEINETSQWVLLHLPLLYREESTLANRIRYTYMKVVSDLYSEHFSNRIGQWCEKRNLQYIGHVIEDNNAHSRLGYGAGHFYKSMKGQTMAGIDVVLHQLMPKYDNGYFKSMTSVGWDGEFFTYLLAKMGASLGQLDANKNGNTMCEVFGAYGWNEGTKLMKWIIDHMLVSGVNYFVPHAFSLKDFPDPDCPPHFYAQGQNPEFKAFGKLMKYTNRMATILSGGKHIADIAVLYHAEAEWSGNYLSTQKVARILSQNQYEFDVVAMEMVQNAEIGVGEFSINNHSFKALLIPYMQRVPMEFLSKLSEFVQAGIQVSFIDGLPVEYIEGKNIQVELLANFNDCPLSNLLNYLSLKNFDYLATERNFDRLRYYHYQKDNHQVYVLFNEDDSVTLDLDFSLDGEKQFLLYDAFENKVYEIEKNNHDYHLTLSPSEAVVIFESNQSIPTHYLRNLLGEEMSLNHQNWVIEAEGIDNRKQLVSLKQNYSTLPILGVKDDLLHFAGRISYSTTLPKVLGRVQLEIENAEEIVEVLVNGVSVGMKISTPYRFDLSNVLTENENQLEVVVTNSLGRSMRDFLSQYLVIRPLGISGKILLRKEK